MVEVTVSKRIPDTNSGGIKTVIVECTGDTSQTYDVNSDAAKIAGAGISVIKGAYHVQPAGLVSAAFVQSTGIVTLGTVADNADTIYLHIIGE